MVLIPTAGIVVTRTFLSVPVQTKEKEVKELCDTATLRRDCCPEGVWQCYEWSKTILTVFRQVVVVISEQFLHDPELNQTLNDPIKVIFLKKKSEDQSNEGR